LGDSLKSGNECERIITQVAERDLLSRLAGICSEQS
jgi:hypothetical protein